MGQQRLLRHGWRTTKTTVRLLGSPTLQTIRLQVQDTGKLVDATTQMMSLSGAACQVYRGYVPLVAGDALGGAWGRAWGRE